MKLKHKLISVAAVLAALSLLAAWYFGRHPVAVLSPSGPVGHQERNLIFVGLLLAVIVVVPVYVMATAIAYKYRESNAGAPYRPDWDGNRLIEITWWAIPGVIITILSIVAWNSAHSLDPFRPLSSSNTPLNIQVVSLDWKWLFIYPQQRIASVNLAEMPVGTPVNFELTSDSVMNSFWVPALGGQIYTMPGMSTQVHLQASRTGDFHGSSANISGEGFAGMAFTARAVSPADFQRWTRRAQNSPTHLSLTAYNRLAEPSQNSPLSEYSQVRTGLYDEIVLKYMTPSAQDEVLMDSLATRSAGYSQ